MKAEPHSSDTETSDWTLKISGTKNAKGPSRKGIQ